MTIDLSRRRPTTRREFVDDLQAARDEAAPVMPWSKFMTEFFRLNQGQHIALIGPTDSGKTTLALNILDTRKYVVATATKPYDETLDHFGRARGYRVIEEWQRLDPQLWPKRLLWPDARDMYAALNQRREFRRAFAHIYREGGWTLYIDELWFICKHLKLEFEMRTFLLQSRSNRITLVVASQRPAWIPLEVYDQSRWLFFWRDNDEANLSRISGISWLSKNLIRSIIARLDPHQVLCINTRTGAMVRTTSPPPEGK